jgi:hypothetical protein
MARSAALRLHPPAVNSTGDREGGRCGSRPGCYSKRPACPGNIDRHSGVDPRYRIPGLPRPWPVGAASLTARRPSAAPPSETEGRQAADAARRLAPPVGFYSLSSFGRYLPQSPAVRPEMNERLEEKGVWRYEEAAALRSLLVCSAMNASAISTIFCCWARGRRET